MTEKKKQILKGPVRFIDLGPMAYARAFELQKRHVQEVISGAPPVVLLCEHPVVLTAGRLWDQRHIKVSREVLQQRQIEVYQVDRGGDVTLHAPGQLVMYPIINLENHKKDLHSYLHQLEQVAIDLLKGFDIVATRFFGKTGVWVDEKKIVSIGIGARRWVTYHGLSLNVNIDLTLFSLIQPCGLDATMTSMAALLRQDADMERVKKKMMESFLNCFGPAGAGRE